MTKPPADPLAIKFPIEVLSLGSTRYETLLMPIIQTYLSFELSWAKQRGLLVIPKPFFPGQHFTNNSELVFVLMPFGQDFDDVYSLCVKPVIEQQRYAVEPMRFFTTAR